MSLPSSSIPVQLGCEYEVFFEHQRTWCTLFTESCRCWHQRRWGELCLGEEIDIHTYMLNCYYDIGALIFLLPFFYTHTHIYMYIYSNPTLSTTLLYNNRIKKLIKKKKRKEKTFQTTVGQCPDSTHYDNNAVSRADMNLWCLLVNFYINCSKHSEEPFCQGRGLRISIA